MAARLEAAASDAGGTEGGGPGGVADAITPAARGDAAAAGAATNNGVPPPASVATCWPASAFFRWEDGAGPRDAWDALPFPPGGPGVFGRLLATATRVSLFHGRRCGFAPAPALSAVLNLSGVLQLIPLKGDDDVEKVVRLAGQLSPGTAAVLTFAVREEGASAAAASAAAAAAAPTHISVGTLPPRPAPAAAAALGDAFPVDAWTAILNVMASSRCVVYVFPGAIPPSLSHPPTL